MQDNSIQSIQGLEQAYQLEKLYLDGNAMSNVSNLQHCTALQELHLSRQTLPPEVNLTFDPATLSSLAASLHTLTAAQCNIVDVSPLHILTQLRVLDLSGNQIASMQHVQQILEDCSEVQTLDLS